MRTTLHKFLVVTFMAIIILCVAMCAKADEPDRVITAHDWTIITALIAEQSRNLEAARNKLSRLQAEQLGIEKCIRSHVKHRRPVLSCFQEDCLIKSGWCQSADHEF